jgi:hypothetical protein
LQQGDPDVEVGITKENCMKLFLKATEKSLITIAYSQNLEIDNSWSDNYFARIRYRYNKKFHFYATTTFKDQDVASQLGRTAVNSLEFRIRVRPHTKINLEIQDVWDESKTNTDDEHETIGRINWYRNF